MTTGCCSDLVTVFVPLCGLTDKRIVHLEKKAGIEQGVAS